MFLFTAGPASAATIAYIDGKDIRLSSADGTARKKLSGPAGDGREWTEVAQADNGRVLAVRREPGKIASLNSFTLWGPKGDVVYQGALKNENGWFISAFPVSLDLTSDGTEVVYGYSNSRGLYPNMEFENGTYVMYADRTAAITPFKITGMQWPTVVGDRIVAASDSIVTVQQPTSQAPYGTDFGQWIETAGTGLELERTDVSADGKVAAIQLAGWEGGSKATGKIAMVRAESFGGPLASGDCMLPSQGVADDPTVSADGKFVAWHDDRGIVSAGVPDFSGADPCNLTKPPVVISATGEFPSFGAASTAGQGPGPGPGPGPGAKGPAVTLPVRVTAASLRGGLTVKVKVKRAGTVKIVGKVNGKIVARGQKRAKAAGQVKVKLKATAKYRKRLGSLKGKTITLTVTAPEGKSKIKRKLR